MLLTVLEPAPAGRTGIAADDFGYLLVLAVLLVLQVAGAA